jgi:DNA repair photolyase
LVRLALALSEPASSSSQSSLPRVSVREVRCATLLHPLNYRSSTEYTANIYKGCTHGCVYCYAPSLTHDERGWGTYVDAKVNAPEVLDRELRNLRKDEVFLSSASDPYQPVEARYRLTRRCLGVLLKHEFPVSILTRSPLVLRDLDLIKRLGWVKVGMSITSVPTRRFEPGVPPLERRIDTLSKLSAAGITTWVSLAPVIPGIVEVDFDKLFLDLSRAGVSSVSFGILRFLGYEESKDMFEKAARTSFAEALAGKDAMTTRLSNLVRSYGMEPTEDESWKPEEPDATSLESFCS